MCRREIENLNVRIVFERIPVYVAKIEADYKNYDEFVQ